MGKLILATLLFVPALSFASADTDVSCKDATQSLKVANAKAEVANAAYADALAAYNQKLVDDRVVVSADQAQLIESMKADIAAEWAKMDVALSSNARKFDRNGNLSAEYARLRRETQARVDLIRTDYVLRMKNLANSYGVQAFEKATMAYNEALRAHWLALVCYDLALTACH